MSNSLIENEFDLYVSVTSAKCIPKVLEDFPFAHVELVENRGRDILPFLGILRKIIDLEYVAVCKIHSKKSLYRNDGSKIRDEIFDTLLGTREKVESILLQFRSQLQVGMIVPQKYLIPHTDHNMTFNHVSVDRISNLLKIHFQYDVFPAGSMFWFSPKSLAQLADIDDSYFEVESGLVDGTSAHAVERLFCLIAKSNKYLIEIC